MYNLLEKLRAGEPFTDADRDYNNKALVSTLKQIHDELDLAVLDAYGWPHNITDEQILENLVALNAERAEEERNGLIRWLRPEYQAPDEIDETQPTLEGLITQEEPIIEPVEQQKWPANPKNSSPPSATCCALPPANGQPNKSPPSSKATLPKRSWMPSVKTAIALNGSASLLLRRKADLPTGTTPKQRKPQRSNHRIRLLMLNPDVSLVTASLAIANSLLQTRCS